MARKELTFFECLETAAECAGAGLFGAFAGAGVTSIACMVGGIFGMALPPFGLTLGIAAAAGLILGVLAILIKALYNYCNSDNEVENQGLDSEILISI